MTFDQMQRMVALAAGNLKPTHPLYIWVTGDSGTDTPSLINQAANRFLRMYVHRLSEMPAAWTIGPTVVDETEHSLVADMLVVFRVVCAHSATEPDWDTARTYPVQYVEPEEYDLLEKGSSNVGYPRIWTKRGKQLFIHPTPSADYIDYLRVYGLMEETELEADGDTFYMNPDWHPLVCRLAASMLEQIRGNHMKAKELLASVRQEMGDAIDVVGEENIGKPFVMMIENYPTRAKVYGS